MRCKMSLAGMQNGPQGDASGAGYKLSRHLTAIGSFRVSIPRWSLTLARDDDRIGHHFAIYLYCVMRPTMGSSEEAAISDWAYIMAEAHVCGGPASVCQTRLETATARSRPQLPSNFSRTLRPGWMAEYGGGYEVQSWSWAKSQRECASWWPKVTAESLIQGMFFVYFGWTVFSRWHPSTYFEIYAWNLVLILHLKNIYDKQKHNSITV